MLSTPLIPEMPFNGDLEDSLLLSFVEHVHEWWVFLFLVFVVVVVVIFLVVRERAGRFITDAVMVL